MIKWTKKDAAKLQRLDRKIGAGEATRQDALAAIKLKNKRAASKGARPY